MSSAQFDANPCRECFEQPHSCDPSPVLCSVAFRSSVVPKLLLDLVPYDENDRDGILPHFYKQVAKELAPKFAVNFRHLVKRSSYLACWRLADVVRCQRYLPPQMLDTTDLPLLLPSYQRPITMAGRSSNFLEVTVYFLLLSFRIRRAWEHVMLCSYYLNIYRLLWTRA